VSDLIPLLCEATGFGEFDVRVIVASAPKRYAVYPIPKRSGGERIISQPARELKALQRALVAKVLCNLPVHDAAMAYRPNVSIKHNALAHVKNGPILKYDFKDFFPSIRNHDWINYCKNHNVFRVEEDISISSNLLFWRPPGRGILQLAIGAPSSPMLSNILMYEFDHAITSSLRDDQVTYTRYADDLVFSAKRTGYLNVVDDILRKIIRQQKYPHIKLNEDKTVEATKKYKRMVTGLILTNDGLVSIGHERKKKIRAGVYNFKCGNLKKDQIAYLSGMIAFAHSVEPEFIVRLSEKYGSDVIIELKRYWNRRSDN
jgi:hypothetical protein